MTAARAPIAPLALLAALSLAACRDQAAGSRGHVTVVGSSTVFPFTAIVAEQMVDSTPGLKSPVIESTGTGAGIKLFCGGEGAGYPDIADASRRMHASEYATCHTNGVRGVMEVQVGLDGVVFAEARGGPGLRLSVADLYRALAAAPSGRPNTARTWAEVNPALPAIPIQVYGPPATSGTRDALAELVLAKGCEVVEPGMAARRTRDPASYARRCTAIREDGAYADAGENDNFIVQKLRANRQAIGIFGYSYLAANRDTLTGVPLDGVAPGYDAIAHGRYPGSRPLYVYVKAAHLGSVAGLRAFLDLYAASWNAGGPLVARGLIAAPADVRMRNVRIVRDAVPLDPANLS